MSLNRYFAMNSDVKDKIGELPFQDELIVDAGNYEDGDMFIRYMAKSPESAEKLEQLNNLDRFYSL